jgi:hypothetical protein
MDILARLDDEETFSQLIDGSLNLFAEQAVGMVTVWILGSPVIEKLFTEKGSYRRDVDRPLILRVNFEHEYRDRVAGSSHWYSTMGDSTEIF